MSEPSITLHGVTKLLGIGHRATVVVENLNWHIPARARIAILGQVGAGKTTLLHLLSGILTPTDGWVERSAVVSSTSSLLRYTDAATTVEQLVHRLSPVYHADPDEMCRFVESFAGLDHAMGFVVHDLAHPVRQRLHYALFYGFDCDFYLFDGNFEIHAAGLHDSCQQAFEQRSKNAGMILATPQPRWAANFGGIGGILHNGHLVLYPSVSEAIEVFEQLPPASIVLDRRLAPLDPLSSEEEESL
jgi:capsular polysaccharide transport system ATP-binding protein